MKTLKSFLWGLGAAAVALGATTLAYMMTPPKVKKMARPVLVKGVSSAIGSLAEKGKEVAEELKECREEKNTADETENSFYDTTLEQMRQERNRALNEIKELRSVISKLQDEINEMKNKNGDW